MGCHCQHQELFRYSWYIITEVDAIQMLVAGVHRHHQHIRTPSTVFDRTHESETISNFARFIKLILCEATATRMKTFSIDSINIFWLVVAYTETVMRTWWMSQKQKCVEDEIMAEQILRTPCACLRFRNRLARVSEWTREKNRRKFLLESENISN